MIVDLVGDKGMILRIRLNTPDEGDDPNNRWDCDSCAHAPEATEPIILILEGDGEGNEGKHLKAKVCTDCAIEIIKEAL